MAAQADPVSAEAAKRPYEAERPLFIAR